jgi:hypothetical protein
LAVLRGEDNVQIYLGQGLRHDGSPVESIRDGVAPFQGAKDIVAR